MFAQRRFGKYTHLDIVCISCASNDRDSVSVWHTFGYLKFDFTHKLSSHRHHISSEFLSIHSHVIYCLWNWKIVIHLVPPAPPNPIKLHMSDIEFIHFPIKKNPIQSFPGGNWLPNCLWCGRCCRHRHCQCLCSKCWWVLVVNITRWSSGLCVNPFENREEKRIKKPENNSSTNKIV